MFIHGKRETTILRMLTAALGVFFVACGGTFAAGRSPLLINAGMPLFANPGIDSVCQTVMDTSKKLFTTPYYVYMTESIAGVGKPVSSEMVFSGGVYYTLSNGKWRLSPASLEEMKAMDERNRKNVKSMSCHYVRDDSVNGESAAVYSTHVENAEGKNDNQVWVSKIKGLILRQETDIDTGGGGKNHLSSRYEYNNVHAPKL